MMDITPTIFFGTITAIVSIIVAFGSYRAFRRKVLQDAADDLTEMRTAIAGKLDRKEHNEICDKANRNIQEKLDLIVGMINSNDRETATVRSIVTEAQKEISSISTRIAVLAATR